MKFKRGDKVFWKWMGGKVKGVVEEAYTQSVSREIKGKLIKRNGTPEKPAYLLKSEAGNLALKLESEVFALLPK